VVGIERIMEENVQITEFSHEGRQIGFGVEIGTEE